MTNTEELYDKLSMGLYWDIRDKIEERLYWQFSSDIDEQSLEILSGMFYGQLIKSQGEELFSEMGKQ